MPSRILEGTVYKLVKDHLSLGGGKVSWSGRTCAAAFPDCDKESGDVLSQQKLGTEVGQGGTGARRGGRGGKE